MNEGKVVQLKHKTREVFFQYHGVISKMHLLPYQMLLIKRIKMNVLSYHGNSLIFLYQPSVFLLSSQISGRYPALYPCSEFIEFLLSSSACVLSSLQDFHKEIPLLRHFPIFPHFSPNTILPRDPKHIIFRSSFSLKLGRHASMCYHITLCLTLTTYHTVF